MSLESQTSTKPTLKELMKDHWAKRDFSVTPETANLVGVSIFLYSIFLFQFLYLLWLLPSTEELWSTVIWKSILCLVIAFQTFMNWRLCVRRHDDIVMCLDCKSRGIFFEKQKVLAAREEGVNYCDSWKYCTFCQTDVPPRAHHCKLCQVCILRRDHHCYFTARCVGFHSQRRFMVCSWYVLIGCILMCSTILSYLSSHLEGNSSWQLLNYFLPIAVFRFVFSNISLKFVFVLIHLYLFFLIGGLAFFFFLWEWLLVLDGKTSYEAKHLIRRYRRSTVMENVRDVFGNYFLIHFIWPFKTALPLDGFNWPVNKKGI